MQTEKEKNSKLNDIELIDNFNQFVESKSSGISKKELSNLRSSLIFLRDCILEKEELSPTQESLLLFLNPVMDKVIDKNKKVGIRLKKLDEFWNRL